MTFPSKRHQLARWLVWFFLVNTIFSLAIQLGYLHLMPNLHLIYGATTARVVFAWTYLMASYITQALIINYVVCAIVGVVILLIPRYWLMASLSILLVALINVSQIADVFSFQLFHTHNMHIAVDVFKAKALQEVIPLSATEIALVVFLFIGMVLLMSSVAYVVRRQVDFHKHGMYGRLVFWLLLVIALFSYILTAFMVWVPPHARLSAVNSRLLLKVVRYVPYYLELYAAVVPGSEDDVRQVETADGLIKVQTKEPDLPLQYPRLPIVCQAPQTKKNIVFIVIDTWRHDAMTKKITPNIVRFAHRTLRFNDHWSGGNCTQPGIFSLFYAIPANYWTAMERQMVGPVFIDQLHREDYQLNILGSATLAFPAFDRTAFVNVPNLTKRVVGNTSRQRDKRITDLFIQFLHDRQANKPFFSFLFYDTAHNYCGGGARENRTPFTPAIAECKRFSLTATTDPLPYLNRYHNAVHYIDGQVQRVLTDLQQKGLLKNTIVVITADHGEEFDDEKLNYWSHASAYTRFQLQVPMLIYWPGMPPRDFGYMTTHYDLVPTLMQKVLGCHSNVANYSVGQSLFDRQRPHWFIAGSYGDYGIVTPEQVVRIYPGGDFVINQRNGHPKPKARLNAPVMRSVYQQLNYFYQ